MQGEALPTLSPEDAERLDLVRCLLKPCGGKVIAGYERGALVLTTAFPTLERTPVLAIEDNADTVRLLDRFLANTRFSLYSASGIDQALSLALSIAPQAIILDVVMPQVDGWESLQRLRHHPATQAVPVLVCTILPEEELALSLGAAAYVHKPFTREELVRVLDRLVAQKA
ncbi:MAG: response regulator [Chloroflexi bacterium]|nr:response regulator [Chloroflexota bacterium]